jgi:hypothetical protein
MFQENQVVRLKKDLPNRNLKAGVIGTVVMVYDYTPIVGYEVEFSDENGVPLEYNRNDPEGSLTVTLHDDDIEPI